MNYFFKFIFDQSEHMTSDTEEVGDFQKYEADTYKGAAYKCNELFVRPLFVRTYTPQVSFVFIALER